MRTARSTAAAFGADHHEQIVTPDAVKVAEVLAYHYDEPFADASAIPTYYVSELARKHVTVCLSGDGGDELFAGYTPYADALKRVGSTGERAMRTVIQAGARLVPVHENALWRLLRGSRRRLSAGCSLVVPVRVPVGVRGFWVTCEGPLSAPDAHAPAGGAHNGHQ